MIAISKMAAAVQPSATLAAGAKAKQTEGRGRQRLRLQPRRTRLPHARTHLRRRRQGHEGRPHALHARLRHSRTAQGRRRWYEKTYGIRYTPEQVLISNGAKHSLHNALAATVGPGDEVIIPTPYWVSYSDLVQMTGAKYVLVPTTLESGFKMTPAQLRAAVTPRSRLLMLNSPSNPTGTVYTRQELEALADVVLETKLAVLSDEIYEKLVFGDAQADLLRHAAAGAGGAHHHHQRGQQDLRHDRLAHGLGAGAGGVIKAMGNVQSQQTGCPCSISQYAALAALEGEQECVETDAPRVRGAARPRRATGWRRCRACKCRTPEGAFYAFFDVSAHFGRTLGGRKVTDSAEFLLWRRWRRPTSTWCPARRSARRAMCGCPTPTSREQLNGGLDRLEQWLQG